MVLGYFGKTPVPPDPNIVKLAQDQLNLPPTTRSPRIINDEDPTKGRAVAEAMLRENGLPITDENVFIAATCKEKGIIFLKGDATVNIRKKKPQNGDDVKHEFPDGMPEKPEDIRSFDVYVDNEYFKVEVNDPLGPPRIRHYPVFPNPTFQTSAAHTQGGMNAGPGVSTPTKKKKDFAPAEGEIAVTAPLPGIIIRYDKKEGDTIKEGETLAVIEAMKMNNNIDSPTDGIMGKLHFKPGKTIDKSDVICTIKAS